MTIRKKDEDKSKSWRVWTFIVIPVLTLIPVYFTMIKGSDTGGQEPGISIIEGDVNSRNQITNIYAGTNSSVKSGKIDLVSTDEMVSKSSYRGTETFAVCGVAKSYTFSFLAVVKNNEKLKNCLIKWGDGTPNQVFQEITTNTIISHTFPEGNSVMQIEVEMESGKTEMTIYNVFVGANPMASFTTSGSTTDICINEPVTFRIGNYRSNPPWTVYTVSFSDGTEPVSFIMPATDSGFSYTRTFKKASTPDNPMFTMMLAVENPCYRTIYTLDHIVVKNCRK